MKGYDRRIKGMMMDRCLVAEGVDQRKFDVEQMAAWVNWLAPWRLIAHLTWKDWHDDQGNPHGITVGGASRSFERFMRRELPRMSYFYAVEPNPSRDGSHVHALWCDVQDLVTKRVGRADLVRSVRGAEGTLDVWRTWFERFGRAKIEVVRNHADITSYCGKHLIAASYTTKQAVWWNVKLQWHRVQKMHDSSFKLRDDLLPWESGCVI